MIAQEDLMVGEEWSGFKGIMLYLGSFFATLLTSAFQTGLKKEGWAIGLPHANLPVPL